MRLVEKTPKGSYILKDPIEIRSKIPNKPSCMEEVEAYHYRLWELSQKLGQLEDIEDELGIDLITLFKALKNGIYIWKTNIVRKRIKTPTIEYAQTTISVNIFNKIGLSPYIDKTTKSKGIVSIGQGMVFGKDYGTTWALTKEELEK